MYDQVQDRIWVRREKFYQYGQNHEINLGIKMFFCRKSFYTNEIKKNIPFRTLSEPKHDSKYPWQKYKLQIYNIYLFEKYLSKN